MSRLVAAALAVGVCACGKSGGGKPSCDDVERVMRKLRTDRSAGVAKGAYASACRSHEEYTQARIECIVKATSAHDLDVCEDPTLAVAGSGTGTGTGAGTGTGSAVAIAAMPPAAWKPVPTFGVQVNAPGDVTVEERDTNAHVGNGGFKLNLFVVDEYSSKSAADQKASLEREPGFVKLVREDVAGKTWRFDYLLGGGMWGTQARIEVGGRLLDCGVHKVDAEVAQAVATACSTAKPL